MKVTIGLRELLINDPTLAAKIGTKVFPLSSPQKTSLPFQLIEETDRTPQGSKNRKSTLEAVNVTISTHAIDLEQAYELAEDARKVLENYKGKSAGVDIRFIEYLGEGDDFDEEKKIHIVEQDYTVWAKRIVN